MLLIEYIVDEHRGLRFTFVKRGERKNCAKRVKGMTAPRVGDAVEFSEPVSLAPHTLILRNERGVVVSAEDVFGEPALEIRLTKPHKGLREWDNVALLVGEDTESVKVV